MGIYKDILEPIKQVLQAAAWDFEDKAHLEENRLRELIALLKHDYPDIDISNYQYVSPIDPDNNGSFEDKINLKELKYTKAATILLNEAGLISVRALTTYMRIAIIKEDRALCECILEKLPQHSLNIDTLIVAGEPPIFFAAYKLKPQILEFLLQKGAKTHCEKDGNKDLFVSIQQGFNHYDPLQITKASTCIDLLKNYGYQVQRHTAHCHILLVNVYGSLKQRNVEEPEIARWLVDVLIENGFNPNIMLDSNSNSNIYPNAYFYHNEYLALKYRALKDLSRDALMDINLGVKIPPAVLETYLRHQSDQVCKLIPIKITIGQTQPNITLDEQRIGAFILGGVSPKSLVCRCYSFSVLDRPMFEAILAATNTCNAALGYGELSPDDLARKLPPHVQNDSLLITILQEINKTKAASYSVLSDVYAAAKAKPPVKE